MTVEEREHSHDQLTVGVAQMAPVWLDREKTMNRKRQSTLTIIE
jgi:hypothetical protein